MISRILRILVVLAASSLSLSVFAAKEPIYINLATDDSAKVLMALDAGRQYAEKGYPIVISLNDKAVSLGLASNGHKSNEELALLKAIAGGAKVIICPSCLEIYGFSNQLLVSGIIAGTPHQVAH